MKEFIKNKLKRLIRPIYRIEAKQEDLLKNQKNLYEKHEDLLKNQKILCEKLDNIQESLKANTFIRYDLLDRLEEIYPYPPISHCPICGTIIPKDAKIYTTECIFNGGKLTRKQCPHCDLIFGPEKMFRLSKNALSKEYEYHYKLFNESDCYEQERKAFFELNPNKDGVYLNYGGGSWANTIPLLREEGYNVFNYEPYAPIKNEFTISDINVLKTMQFDGIFSHDLLEHLCDPIEELRFMSTLIKDDAIMNHATACYSYKYEYTRFHLFFFLGKSKYILAQKSGLTIVDYVEESEFINGACKFIKNTAKL